MKTTPARKALVATLSHHGLHGPVSVLLTDNEQIRTLNREHRGIDEATDVLTFPGGDFPGAPLGDIAISAQTARSQAKERGIPWEVELAYLAIHAGLHLAGFEDESEGERRRMQAEMASIAQICDLPVDPEWVSLHGEDQP